METLKQNLIAYIESLSHYEISRFLQFHKALVEKANYYAENTPISVYEDIQQQKIEDKINELTSLLLSNKKMAQYASSLM